MRPQLFIAVAFYFSHPIHLELYFALGKTYSYKLEYNLLDCTVIFFSIHDDAGSGNQILKPTVPLIVVAFCLLLLRCFLFPAPALYPRLFS